MRDHYRSGVLERDFHVLFDNNAQWKWPFAGEGILGTIFSLGITTFLATIFINIFVHIDFGRNGFIALAAVVFLWEVFRLNWVFLRDESLRKKLRKKYFPIVEHTEAFELLEEAVASRRKGIVDGFGTKEETEAAMIRLWKAAFAEAGSLSTPTSPTEVRFDPLDSQPVGNHINRYFEERAASYQEINA